MNHAFIDSCTGWIIAANLILALFCGNLLWSVAFVFISIFSLVVSSVLKSRFSTDLESHDDID